MNRRLLALIALAAVIIVFAVSRSEFQVEALRETIAAAGPWGPLLFVVCFSVLEGLGFPGILFILASVAIWPTELAMLLNWAGAVGANPTAVDYDEYAEGEARLGLAQRDVAGDRAGVV